MRRPAAVLRHMLYGASAFAAMALEDPTLLMVQAARRMPPQVRSRVADLLERGSGDWRPAVAAWLRGHDEGAAEAVAAVLEGDTRAPRRLLAEIGVLLAVPGAQEQGSRSTRARAAFRSGDLDEAVRLAGGTGLASRYDSELQILTPGNALRIRPPRRRASSTGTRALHVLTNSRPHTESGYAVRSHHVLRAQQDAGVVVRAVTRVGYPVTVGRPFALDVDVVDGVEYERLIPWAHRATPGGQLQQQLALARSVAEEFRPSVLHTTTNHRNAIVTRALANELDIPWVYEVRGVMEDTWVASFPADQQAAARSSRRHRLTRERETELSLAADAVVAISETLRDDLIARGVPAERITVVPNGVDASLFDIHETPQGARRRLGLPPDGFWVGTVTSLVGYEGVDTLIEGVRLARDQGLDVRAAIVGDGVSRPALVRQVETSGLGDVIVMPGRVPVEAACDWYLALDAFTISRRDTEVTRRVTPIKHLTAMALGRPVVSSDLPALAESTAGAALLTSAEDPGALADEWSQLIGDPALRSELARRGREVASGRTWAQLGQRYRALYERLT